MTLKLNLLITGLGIIALKQGRISHKTQLDRKEGILHYMGM